MNERVRGESRATDVEKSLIAKRGLKGFRRDQLLISGKPRIEGTVDLEGLTQQIDENKVNKPRPRHQRIIYRRRQFS